VALADRFHTSQNVVSASCIIVSPHVGDFLGDHFLFDIITLAQIHGLGRFGLDCTIDAIEDVSNGGLGGIMRFSCCLGMHAGSW
jgi:hypothetical protein